MTPRSTYRLQLRAEFDLDAAAGLVDYLHALGVDWVYLSPLLASSEGSDHGYDTVDLSRIDPARGGAAGLARLSAAARTAGMGILVDIVPNHVGVAVPEQNPWWWDLLRRGRESRYAEAFDIDWQVGGGKVILPILGAELAEVIDEFTLDPTPRPDAPDGVLRYHEHVLPLAPESASIRSAATTADTIDAVIGRQHYRPVHWRREATDLNYRRFFAVSTLAGLRVEVPWVFDAAHAQIARWFREGLVDGVRVDHPDGLADPGEYLQRLAGVTGGGYTVVEKILERAATEDPEELSARWRADGTTGYDAMAEIDRVLIDPAGAEGLDAIDARLRAQTGLPPAQAWQDLIHDTKRAVADTILRAEVRRLARCLPELIGAAEDALAEILANFPVYRSYLPEGREHLAVAIDAARGHRPDLADSLARLAPILADPANEAARRFQQTTGAVMAKGVEDTAFYRCSRLGTLTEVGGDPSVFAVTTAQFHRLQAARHASWPSSLTALSTHDTKRGEDVRARISVLAEIPELWQEFLTAVLPAASCGHGPFDNLLWQAIVGAWPADRDRLQDYACKAAREAGEATSWTVPDAAFEHRVRAVVDAAFDEPGVNARLTDLVHAIAGFGWSNALSAKTLALAGPGVPDVYQGSELWEQSLVDPDNRRPVDFTLRRELLARIDAGWVPPIDAGGAAKLLITSRLLRLRRDRPELFRGYRPVQADGPAAAHVIATDRGGAQVFTTRLPVGLAARGGWADTTLMLPERALTDVFTGRRFGGGAVALGTVMADYPVAVLVEG